MPEGAVCPSAPARRAAHHLCADLEVHARVPLCLQRAAPRSGQPADLPAERAAGPSVGGDRRREGPSRWLPSCAPVGEGDVRPRAPQRLELEAQSRGPLGQGQLCVRRHRRLRLPGRLEKQPCHPALLHDAAGQRKHPRAGKPCPHRPDQPQPRQAGRAPGSFLASHRRRNRADHQRALQPQGPRGHRAPAAQPRRVSPRTEGEPLCHADLWRHEGARRRRVVDR
mmetsp:Transcript_13405/g.31753  ORF Transcript_13405/g.31753 Transcript_13405/m.31753 type:complete len:225 (+) Transcript_13405:372-1046(+)